MNGCFGFNSVYGGYSVIQPDENTQLIARHIETSRRFIRHADLMLDEGDLLQASEKAWGAVAHRLKAIARQRNWRHSGHRDFYMIIDALKNEADDPEEFDVCFKSADQLHGNFYNDFLPESAVSDNIENVQTLLRMLDYIESSSTSGDGNQDGEMDSV